MDENHQDKTESELIATKEIKWIFNKRKKLWIPQHRKRTGFEDRTRWDRLQLFAQVFGAFAIPLSIIALIIGVLQFNGQQAATQAQVLDQQRQTTLDTYIDKMSDLLLTYPDHFRVYKQGDQFQEIAETLTFTALRNLDGYRKAYLIRFLEGANLIDTQNPIIRVFGANLTGVVFAIDYAHPVLDGVSLFEDILYGANLSGVSLVRTDLRYTSLQGANLSGTNLDRTYMLGANYNTKTMHVMDQQGNPLTLEPTQWPKGFDPVNEGLFCVDC